MAHNPRALSRAASSGYGDNHSCSLFFYRTLDPIATVLTSGYFNTSRSQLNVGDQIIVTADSSGSMVGDLLIVTAVPAGSGNVTVSAIQGSITGGQSHVTDVPTNLSDSADGTAIAAAVNGNATAINAIIAALETAGITLTS